MHVSVVGIGWYEREDYPRILEVMEDARLLPRTYNEFLEKAHLGERKLTSAGHRVVHAVIKPDEFVSWCRARNLKIDTHARQRWGNEFAYASAKEAQ